MHLTDFKNCKGNPIHPDGDGSRVAINCSLGRFWDSWSGRSYHQCWKGAEILGVRDFQRRLCWPRLGLVLSAALLLS